MAKKHLRKYTAEFKQQALRLAEDLGSRRIAAERLGISQANLSNWSAKMKEDGQLRNSKNSVRKPSEGETQEQELKRLRKENEELKKVNYILKRAAAFFSQDHLK